MARYLGLVSSDLRGKIGGTVGTRATSGTTLRKHVSGTQPRTPAQAKARHLLGYLAGAWRDLGSSGQATWASLATMTTLTNSLGVQYVPSGQQLYIACNQTYYTRLGYTLDTAPATVPNVPVASSMSLVITGGVMELTINSTYTGAIPAFKVSISPPMSYGARYRHRSQCKFITFYYPPDGTVDITSAWNAVYGALPGPCYLKMYALPTDGSSGFPGTVSSGIYAVS